MPIVNGKSADIAIKGAIGILGLIMILITVIVVDGKPIPEIFVSTATLVVGFLIGSRTVSNDVKDKAVEKAVKENGNV